MIKSILQTKKRKKDKRKGRLRRLSLAEVLKLRKFRKQVKEFQNAKEREEDKKKYGANDDDEENVNMISADGQKVIEYNQYNDRYKTAMNAMIEQLEMSKEQIKSKKEREKKLTVDNFKNTKRTKYRTYIPKQ